jgi:dihydrodipicolinate synthase/N-acetylneuraminate lyase
VTTASAIGAMCVTPFDAAGHIDEQALATLVDRIAASDTTVYLGSYGSGEGHLLRDDEIRTLYRVGVEAAAGRVPVVASALGFSETSRVIEQALEADALGVDAVQIHPPRPGPTAIVPRRAELEQYYGDVFAEVRSPVQLTNQVVMVGYRLPLDLVESLLTNYDNITQLNSSDQDGIAHTALLLRLADRVPVFTGVISQLVTTLALGGAGSLNFESVVSPVVCHDVVEAFRAGDVDRLRSRFSRLLRLNAVLSRFQNPRSLKAALHLMGLPGGELRRPYLALEDHEVAEIRATFVQLGLLNG